MENRNEEYQPLLPEYRLLPRRITRENADAKLTEVRMRRATESQREAVHVDPRVPISWPCCLCPSGLRYASLSTAAGTSQKGRAGRRFKLSCSTHFPCLPLPADYI